MALFRLQPICSSMKKIIPLYSKSIRRSKQQLQNWKLRRLNSSSGSRGGHYVGLWKPAAFTLMVGGVSYSLSGIHRVQSRRNLNSRLKSLYDVENDSLLKRLRRWWWEIGPVRRFVIGIVSINATVFVMWKIPFLLNTMTRYFISGMQSNRECLPLLLSSFSHINFLHICINMFAFSTFAGSAMYVLGDTTSCSNILPYYLTAATFASTIGWYYKKVIRTHSIGSLGASGALLAVLTLVIMTYPNDTVALIFLPFIPIKASVALGGVVALDIMGLIRGWSFFDHAAHLGGVLFAVLYKVWLYKVFQKIQYHSGNLWMKV